MQQVAHIINAKDVRLGLVILLGTGKTGSGVVTSTGDDGLWLQVLQCALMNESELDVMDTLAFLSTEKQGVVKPHFFKCIWKNTHTHTETDLLIIRGTGATNENVYSHLQDLWSHV